MCSHKRSWYLIYCVRNVYHKDLGNQRRYNRIIMQRNGKSKPGSSVALATG